MKHQPYTPAAKTDVMTTWRRFGYTPPSEEQFYLDKWKLYRSLYLQEHEECQSKDIAPNAKGLSR